MYIFSNWKQADDKNLTLLLTAYTWNTFVNLDDELNTRVTSYVHEYIVFFFPMKNEHSNLWMILNNTYEEYNDHAYLLFKIILNIYFTRVKI